MPTSPELLRRLGLWFLVNVPANADLGETIALYRAGVETLRGTFATLVSPYEAHDTEARIAHLRDAGVPLDIAEDVAVLPLLASAPEIVLLAAARKLPIDLVAGAYFALGADHRPRPPARARRRAFPAANIGTASPCAGSSTISIRGSVAWSAMR